MNKILYIFLLLLILPTTGYSNENHQNGVADLSPKLHKLFSQEMIALEKGMKEIMSYYISGNWVEIASTAKKIQNSFVLKQNISEQQMHELHSKLPADFLKLDGEFHYLAGMLSHAADMEKVELIGFYYSKMSETCVSCHSTYATKKFPLFESAETKSEHEH